MGNNRNCKDVMSARDIVKVDSADDVLFIKYKKARERKDANLSDLGDWTTESLVYPAAEIIKLSRKEFLREK